MPHARTVLGSPQKTDTTTRVGPDFRGRSAVQELDEALILGRSHWEGPMSAVRTDRMASRASVDNLMVFSVPLAGRGRVRQHDRLVERAAGTGILIEARSRYERVSSTETGSLTLRFSRELLPLRTAEITEACARSIDPATPAMQMLSGYFGRLFEVADDLTGQQRRDAGRAAIDLTTFERAFRRQYGMTPASWRREHLRSRPLP
jgi:hypothetical protein